MMNLLIRNLPLWINQESYVSMYVSIYVYMYRCKYVCMYLSVKLWSYSLKQILRLKYFFKSSINLPNHVSKIG